MTSPMQHDTVQNQADVLASIEATHATVAAMHVGEKTVEHAISEEMPGARPAPMDDLQKRFNAFADGASPVIPPQPSTTERVAVASKKAVATTARATRTAAGKAVEVVASTLD